MKLVGSCSVCETGAQQSQFDTETVKDSWRPLLFSQQWKPGEAGSDVSGGIIVRKGQVSSVVRGRTKSKKANQCPSATPPPLFKSGWIAEGATHFWNGSSHIN